LQPWIVCLDKPARKKAALVARVDGFFPARTAGLRQSAALEIKATSVVATQIERGSAKMRTKGVADDELPSYAERLPVRLVTGTPDPCPRLMAGSARPDMLAFRRVGRTLEAAVLEAHAVTSHGDTAGAKRSRHGSITDQRVQQPSASSRYRQLPHLRVRK